MKPIGREVFTHLNAAAGEWTRAEQVACGPGYPVRSYRELVGLLAALGYKNRRFNLLFRGQARDYRSPRNQRSLLLPTIFRPHGASRAEVRRRFGALQDATRCLVEHRRILGELGPGLYRHWEYQAALLQHYDICPTPLLDLSSSLRVACSFALLRAVPEAYLYVLGLPHPQGSISHYVDDDLVLVKLLNVCPPEALRPHFQEGYLLGRLTAFDALKCSRDNAASRLIAKYRLLNPGASFWDEAFPAIPESALLPPRDPFGDKLRELLCARPASQPLERATKNS